MTQTLDLLTTALLDAARKAGAESADALAVRGASQSVQLRGGKLEQAERSESLDIGLRVMMGGRQACVSASDASPATIARLAERAGGIIQRVNAFARKRELSRQRMDLVALLHRVLASDGTLPVPMCWAPDRPIWIQADELLLEHLLNNLIGNAQYWAQHGAGGESGAQVCLELRQDDAQALAVLTVADSGPGVPEEAQASIFNAFVSQKEGGMGMGLAICRSIVEAHHGRIEVGRDTQLGGACFTVFLPLSAAPGQAPSQTA